MKRHLHLWAALAALALALPAVSAEVFTTGPGWLEFPAGKGPGAGKHVVLLAGDEEYRSEESLPMLAKILSQRHGFKCTVLFSAAEDGTITPNDATSLTNPEAIDKADLFITSLRFRTWPEESLARFEKAVDSGKPIIGLRTSTHAFTKNRLDSFGKKVLGEKWVSHWGKHKSEATRGVIEPGAEGSSLLHGVSDVFGTSDVYEAYPPADATILLRGQVLAGMTPDAKPAEYPKKRSTDKQEQDVNSPMMPVAWTRLNQTESGHTNRVLCTTMGAANEFENESLRRLVVNGVYWGLQMDVPSKADVTIVDEYKPGFYGFNGYRKGMKVSDLGLGKAMPGEPNLAPVPKP
jgi:type 1 glutamine amidotransferase